MKSLQAQAEDEIKAKRRLLAITKANTLSQAGRVFVKFGGPMRLSTILTLIGRPRTYSTVFRWDYPREKGGCGGIIPSKAWPDVFLAARMEGIILSSADLDPRVKFMNPLDLRAFPEVLRKNRKRLYTGCYTDPNLANGIGQKRKRRKPK